MSVITVRLTRGPRSHHIVLFNLASCNNREWVAQLLLRSRRIRSTLTFCFRNMYYSCVIFKMCLFLVFLVFIVSEQTHNSFSAHLFRRLFLKKLGKSKSHKLTFFFTIECENGKMCHFKKSIAAY